MALALVGMSGVGKSYWSKLLEKEYGFKRYCIDDLIEQALAAELKPLGLSGVHDLSRWMGQPYEAGFEEKQIKYLLLERQAMKDILAELSLLLGQEQNRVVIDTTGSVIYTGRDMREELKSLSTIVHLESPSSELDRILKIFLAEPKPVIWGHLYNERPNEERARALKRCYGQLLALRERQYRSFGTISIPWEKFRAKNLTLKEFLSLCGYALP